MTIRKDRSTWRIKPRYTRRRDDRPLKEFALDITLRFSAGVFLEDHNSKREGVMHFDTVEAACQFLTEQIKANYAEHYAA